MTSEIRWRCEITEEVAARAGPQFEELFLWWDDRWREASRTRRRASLRALRWLGLSASLAGVGLTGFLIVVTPDAPCYRGHSALFYDATMPFFVVLATVFGFMPRITPALQAWSRRVGVRQARRLAVKTRRAAPYSVEYVLSDGRLEARVARPRLTSVTALRRVESAALAEDVACLYGGRFPHVVKRIAWLPDAGARVALREALRSAGASVHDVPPGAGPRPVG
ncbi:MAG TPA: hypothetical protein VIV57_23850 [Anaeromyxobacter sp.]